MESIRGKAALKEVNIQFDVPIRVFPQCSQKLFFFLEDFNRKYRTGAMKYLKAHVQQRAFTSDPRNRFMI